MLIKFRTLDWQVVIFNKCGCANSLVPTPQVVVSHLQVVVSFTSQEEKLFLVDLGLGCWNFEKLTEPHLCKTPDMSKMHHDSSPDLRVVGPKIKDLLQIPNFSLKKRKVIHKLCHIVATRGARLATAGIFRILKKAGRDTLPSCKNKKTVVAMDGGLYEHYTEFRECLEDTLKELVGDQVWEKISIEHANDGSGIGVALLAASHSRYPEVNENRENRFVFVTTCSCNNSS